MTARLIESAKEIAAGHFLLNIESGTDKSSPGQFITLKAGDGFDPLLRRPFLIFDHREKIIQIVVQVVGRGTSLIASALPGEIDIDIAAIHRYTAITRLDPDARDSILPLACRIGAPKRVNLRFSSDCLAFFRGCRRHVDGVFFLPFGQCVFQVFKTFLFFRHDLLIPCVLRIQCAEIDLFG